MEELQSTEILDREILEDARKKAFRILKTADETVKAKSAEWEQKLSAALLELERKYAEQNRSAAAEIMARLPMDKRRAQAEKVEGLLRQAVEAWYNGLSRGQVLSLLEKELSIRLAAAAEESGGGFSGTRPLALIHKLEQNEAAALLRSVLPGVECAVTEQPSPGLFPEIVIENGDVRITASIQKTVDFFLGEKRAELVTALLGEKITEDVPPPQGAR